MGNNTHFIYTETALLKVIEDHDSVRIKVCPVILDNLDGPLRYDEMAGAVEVCLPRQQSNLLIRAVRYARNRTWGKDE